MIARDASDPPAEIRKLFVLLDVALPLSRIGAMLVALVLDGDPEARVGEVHTSDESPVWVEHVVVRDRGSVTTRDRSGLI